MGAISELSATRPQMILQACDKCGGALALWFEDDYYCLQCGKVFYDLPLKARREVVWPATSVTPARSRS